MKPGDYANGRTFLGWVVRLRSDRGLTVTTFCLTLDEARTTYSDMRGTWTRKIKRVYRKDSPMRAALRALLESYQSLYCGTTPAEQRAKEVLGL